MGTAAEAALLCSTVAREILLCLSVEDLFNCARYDPLWEELALPLLSKRLRFFLLCEDKIDPPFVSKTFTTELRSRLRIAERASRSPALAIAFCSGTRYDTSSLSSSFPDEVSVVRIDVRCPIWVQQHGLEERQAACLCLLVLYEVPGAIIECEWSPFVACRRPAAKAALFNRLRRTMRPDCFEPTYHHPTENCPVRFALYATSAFSKTVFKNSQRMDRMASCVLWTSCLRVLSPPSRSRFLPHAYWGAMIFGESVRATTVKFRERTALPRMYEHLEDLRCAFGDLEGALVLVLQENDLSTFVMEAVCNIFAGATAIVGTSCGLSLDENVFVATEPHEASGASMCLKSPVVVALLDTFKT
ncbi:uncharacterized protein [Dermacentor andersoni]|uniref:uncharacterized protein n=1 Tax=Dermacentor andersoni TaxID=34620 RepID=UPI002417CDF3|nr:uncharacterized protein LOC129382646 [Dermacentor andersoni]